MHPNPFIGREAEMARLRGLLEKNSASLIVVRGRRRIGKSRLLAEFGKEMKSLFFTGTLPHLKTTAQSQREEFTKQLSKLGMPGVEADDWGNMFWHLSKHTQRGRILLVFDEIFWMGGKDFEFLGQLKNCWDLYFSKNPHLILVLSGSNSPWIEDNILNSTGFFGRICLDLILEEIPLKACNFFWRPHEKIITSSEKFKILSVTGGVPYYFEQINSNIPAEQNIQELCFTKEGLLVEEFDKIFSDLFPHHHENYRKILTSLSGGSKDLTQLCRELKRHPKETADANYTRQLEKLEKAGFIKRDFTWHLHNGQESKLSRFRLSDNYLRFYIKYIAPNRAKIEKGVLPSPVLTSLSKWDTVMELQLRNLILHNRRTIWKN